MPVFYDDENIHGTFVQPQFTRLRHRYRGPRESWKINLEHGQMSYQIYKLYEKAGTIRTKYLDNVELLESGDEAIVEGYPGLMPSNTLEPSNTLHPQDPIPHIQIFGLDTLTERIQRLQQRIRFLESQ